MSKTFDRTIIAACFLIGYCILFMPWVEIVSHVETSPYIVGLNTASQPNSITEQTSTIVFWQNEPSVLSCPAKVKWKSPALQKGFESYKLLGYVAALSIIAVCVVIIATHRKEDLGVSRRFVAGLGLVLALVGVVALAITVPMTSCQPSPKMLVQEIRVVPFTGMVWLAGISLGVYKVVTHNRHG